ncbi:hypothetical protein BTN49_1095 [Candidatus Enterovibrio escicola]|uniref:Uncharacterized protein n=1 Tax=Candidatus Enterovibrio escicola TaxID=1927127 RepID=A0A2A5T4Q5_9GAMM|nr:hypothetical protein BTN49_1095 [Candidatus Enterovibrio escacola]
MYSIDFSSYKLTLDVVLPANKTVKKHGIGVGENQRYRC